MALPLGDAEIAATRDALNWPYAPLVIPDDSGDTVVGGNPLDPRL